MFHVRLMAEKFHRQCSVKQQVATKTRLLDVLTHVYFNLLIENYYINTYTYLKYHQLN
jgi:hypothetical protein